MLASSQKSILLQARKLLGFAVVIASWTGAVGSAQASGLGGFDLKSSRDLAFAFDYNSSGNLDHIVFYRPGSGIVYIEAKENGAYMPVFSSTSGIGGYDLKSTSDQMIAFDYNGSGHADHLLCYRPGSGIIYILEKTVSGFAPVYTSFSGIGTYDLKSAHDRIIAFDYDGNGRYDHLVLYRPGTGIVYILQNANGVFTTEMTSSEGIGGYDLRSTNDRLIAYDYYSIGAADHLIAYRPGSGDVYILENSDGSGEFTAVETGVGIGGFDLKASSDVLLAYDYTGSGDQDHLLAYRPGSGLAYVIQQAYFFHTPVFSSSTGIGGYDLTSSADRIFTFDADSTGYLTDLVLYRPGSAMISIEQNTNNTFMPAVLQDANTVQ